MPSLAFRVAVVVFLIAQISEPAAAATATTQTCALLVSEARFDLDDLREREHLATIRLAADQAIFELIEPLWEARSIERLRFLAAKYDRDRARLSVRRAAVASSRAAAKLEVLEGGCEITSATGEKSPDGFEALGCELVRKRKEMAALNLTYRKEVLESTEQLRRLELATAQELIQAQYDLDLAKSRLRSHTSRLSECAKADPPN